MLDLAEDGAHGLGEPPRQAAHGRAAEPEPAFFVPEAETAEGEAIDITMPDTPAPRFAESETPPLGLPMPCPAARLRGARNRSRSPRRGGSASRSRLPLGGPLGRL